MENINLVQQFNQMVDTIETIKTLITILVVVEVTTLVGGIFYLYKLSKVQGE